MLETTATSYGRVCLLAGPQPETPRFDPPVVYLSPIHGNSILSSSTNSEAEYSKSIKSEAMNGYILWVINVNTLPIVRYSAKS